MCQHYEIRLLEDRQGNLSASDRQNVWQCAIWWPPLMKASSVAEMESARAELANLAGVLCCFFVYLSPCLLFFLMKDTQTLCHCVSLADPALKHCLSLTTKKELAPVCVSVHPHMCRTHCASSYPLILHLYFSSSSSSSYLFQKRDTLFLAKLGQNKQPSSHCVDEKRPQCAHWTRLKAHPGRQCANLMLSAKN